MFTDVANSTDLQESAIAQIAAFARSSLFDRMFREGMDLVEETANYLDGEGRQEAKALDRSGALAYASESMRLTTRLMQSASWLLVQRAVREGEMSPEDAKDPKYRLTARAVCTAVSDNTSALPERLQDLLERSKRIYERVERIDSSMFEPDVMLAHNPVNDQLARLQAALSASAAQAWA